jgi:hypothetical protein
MTSCVKLAASHQPWVRRAMSASRKLTAILAAGQVMGA